MPIPGLHNQPEGATTDDLDDATTESPTDARSAGGAMAAGRPTAGARARRALERASDLRLDGGRAIALGAIGSVVAIALKTLLAAVLQGDPGHVLLLTAVVAAAWFGGLTGGISATVVALVVVLLLFDRQAVGADAGDHIRLALFLIAAVAIVPLVASRRAERDRLAGALEEVASLAEDIEARDARLELMLSASGTGFWEWDIMTGALLWSDAIFSQHGLPVSDHAPDFQAYLSSIHPDDRGGFEEAIAAALDGEDAFTLDFRLVWPDGSTHWTHCAGRVFRDRSGRAVRMIGTGQDVTERQRLMDERDVLLLDERLAGEFREAFMDVISHELRTPITTILGLTEILARPDRVDDPVARAAMLDDVRAESERLHHLVEDLLVLSRVERGRLTVESEPLEARRLLERIVEHEAADLPGLKVRLRMEDPLPIVAGEATYVTQIMRNLLGNAAKYTPPGTNVVVDARKEDDTVAIRVTDDGPGIPADSRQRIFELFYRDPASARTVAGSGIGLFVCTSLAEAMGGHMWVASPPGGGTEFGFKLRTVPDDETEAVEPTAPGPTPGT